MTWLKKLVQVEELPESMESQDQATILTMDAIAGNCNTLRLIE